MKRQLKLRIRLCAYAALGPGKISLLQAIAHTGSISAAARDQGMSYRRAWLLLDEMNRALLQPVVQTQAGGSHGGGAQLTATGERLIVLYHQIEEKAEQAIRDELGELSGMLAPETPQPEA